MQELHLDLNADFILQEAGLIRNNKKYIDLATQKSGSIFTTRHLRELSDEYSRLQGEYEKKQRGIVKDIVAIAGV